MQLQVLRYERGKGWSEKFQRGLDSDQTIIIVFGASSFFGEEQPFKEIAENFPASKIVGCSTAGEIVGATVRDESLAVSIVKFEKSQVKVAFSKIENSDDSFRAGRDIAEQLINPDLQGVLIFSDGINVNGSKLVEGINSILPKEVKTTGGLAGDNVRFETTWILNNGFPVKSMVSAVGLYGKELNIGYGSRDGLDFLGIERVVTRSENNVLFELDGQPALELYKKYLGDEAASLPASGLFFPLSLRTDSQEEKRLVRTILSVDEKDQSMTFAGDIPEGSFVQLMRANQDRIIDGASKTAEYALQKIKTEKKILSLAVSCVGRRLVLGERAEEELDAVFEIFPSNVHQIGFYSYGEISPVGNEPCDLHNQTLTLTTLSEN